MASEWDAAIDAAVAELRRQAYRSDGTGLQTIGGEDFPDGTHSANFCCGCEENDEGVQHLIDAVERLRRS